jgi:hypothetical protein
VLNRIGDASYQLKDYPAAVASYEKSLQLSDTHKTELPAPLQFQPAVYVQLARSQGLAGARLKALAVILLALETAPEARQEEARTVLRPELTHIVESLRGIDRRIKWRDYEPRSKAG